MKANPEFDVATFTKEFLEYRKRYADNGQLSASDTLRTRALEAKIQEEVNIRLENQVEAA